MRVEWLIAAGVAAYALTRISASGEMREVSAAPASALPKIGGDYGGDVSPIGGGGPKPDTRPVKGSFPVSETIAKTPEVERREDRISRLSELDLLDER